MNKQEQLQNLSLMINDFIKTQQNRWRLINSHHSLWAGNPESNIMVAQLNPDRVENSRAIAANNFEGHTLTNPRGYVFKRAAERSGFIVDYKENKDGSIAAPDFFYCNIIPFCRIAETKFTISESSDLMWIFESIISEIIKPKIIVTLGRDTLSVMVGKEVSNASFLHIIKHNQVIETDDHMIVPIEDPLIVDSDNTLRNKHFYETLRRLYPKTHFIR